jgi:hypothetical protein
MASRSWAVQGGWRDVDVNGAYHIADVTPDNRGCVFGVPGRGGARAQGGRPEHREEGDSVGVTSVR